ncbi:uncharacterized protein N7446_001958 [Penicillium canescens]|uniref:uncharacterized protein n=1 Tax=Penicillium canescens TaxID=5083 RepID=UPI0026DEDB38|nr:uncharacterized protein N7446_001958 [Penicillium canescens]KAJ6055233.1 hypothetical protein N7444_004331 [Penicillium canescens]KAJ6074181.1 hypothetical protein N7446_001958 [Penicillium canescens]
MGSFYSPVEHIKEKTIDQKDVVSGVGERLRRLNFRIVEEIKVEGGIRIDFLSPESSEVPSIDTSIAHVHAAVDL